MAQLDRLRVVALWPLLMAGGAMADTNAAPAIPPHRSYDEVVASELAQHTEQLLMLIARQGHGFSKIGRAHV